ncbi:MAG: hypothetical protein IKY72_04430 [Bacteroidaceae bacterium]|nr:hypothetical protein [Bacteroidaceae bacterium]
MNRIILVGNGFDLAHNLRTSYKDFIEWYWNSWLDNLREYYGTKKEDDFFSIELSAQFEFWADIFQYLRNVISNDTFHEFIENAERYGYKIKKTYKSHFFENINKSIDTKGWVDIENEYYKQLIEDKNTTKLNDEFDSLRKLLIQYLNEQEEHIPEIINNTIQQHILSPIYDNEIAISERNKWIEFLKYRDGYRGDLEHYDYWVELLNSYYNNDWAKSSFDAIRSFEKEFELQIDNYGIASVPIASFPDAYLLPDRILLLNFNYTKVADKYLPNAERFSTIHIHGELSDPNSIIFGYGDEKDKEYNGIIDKNDNEYLRHMKQPHYSESDNYRQMLAFIESAPYQVYVMGHSCGNSDRTLLNTLFEHPNCVSIKPFYYVNKESGKDNYLDIVQNISRNFTDAKKMRDRVVNKTYCQPLPQLNTDMSDTSF